MPRTPRRPGRVRALALLALGAAVAAPLAATPAQAEEVAAPVTVSAPGMVLDTPSEGDRIVTSAGWTLRHPVPAVGLWRPGSVTAELDVSPALAAGPGAVLSVKAGADLCEGGAQMDVTVDGAAAGGFVVDADTGLYPLPAPVAAGRHRVVVSYREDHVAAGCDRSLKVLTVTATSAARAPHLRVTAGPASLPSPDGGWTVMGAGLPIGAVRLYRPSSVVRDFVLPPTAASRVVVGTVEEWYCRDPAQYDVFVDGQRIGRRTDTSVGGDNGATGWSALPVGPLAAGPHHVQVVFVNDFAGRDSWGTYCDRDLSIRSVSIQA